MRANLLLWPAQENVWGERSAGHPRDMFATPTDWPAARKMLETSTEEAARRALGLWDEMGRSASGKGRVVLPS